MVRTAKAMGITDLDRKVGPAVTLGGVDVKLLDLTYAYSVFANNGTMAGAPTVLSLPEGNRHLDPISVLTVTDPLGHVLLDNTQPKTEPIIRPEYAYMITDILSNDDNRKATFGSDSVLNLPGWQAAVKSGTSEPFTVSAAEEAGRPTSDTWSVGYTTDIAVGVWIGNSDNSRMKNMYSTTIAAPLWHDVMMEALKGKTPQNFVRPDGLVEATVCVPSGLPVQSRRKVPDGDRPLRRRRAGASREAITGAARSWTGSSPPTSARPASPARFRAGSATWRTSIWAATAVPTGPTRRRSRSVRPRRSRRALRRPLRRQSPAGTPAPTAAPAAPPAASLPRPRRRRRSLRTHQALTGSESRTEREEECGRC